MMLDRASSEPAAPWRTWLYGTAMLTIPLMSTLIPGAWLRTEAATTYRLALPCLAIWLGVQRELRRRAPTVARAASTSDQLGVDVELDVALQRG